MFTHEMGKGTKKWAFIGSFICIWENGRRYLFSESRIINLTQNTQVFKQ